MFLPNLMPANTHHLWLEDNDQGSNYLRKRKQFGSSVTGRNQRQVRQQNQHQQHQHQQQSQYGSRGYYGSRGARFAPPLSSYSSASVGATITTLASTNVFSNEVEARLAYLDSIKTLGYSYLKPLGVEKTMQKMIDDRKMELQENDNGEYTESMPGTAENLLRNTNSGVNNGMIFQDPTGEDSERRINSLTAGSIQPQAEGTGFTTNNTTGSRLERSELQVDLDADIPDHDDDNYGDEYLSGVFEENDNEFDEDSDYDGFMAAEEEYEDDNDNDIGNVLESDSQTQSNPEQINSNIPTQSSGPTTGNTNNSVSAFNMLNRASQQPQRNNSFNYNSSTHQESGFYDSELNVELIQMRSNGTRNISTSTRLSSFNPELLAQADFGDDNVGSNVNSGYRTGLNSTNTGDLLQLHSEMYHLFSRNTTQNEDNEDSDMEVE